MVAGCSSNKPPVGEPGGGAVTIKHKFGQTTVASPPKRVVSAGFTEHDDLLAVGVVPVAVTSWWGDQPFGVWPWAQPKLAGAQPVVLSLSDGLQFDQIAALKPDLIVATNAGLDHDSYNRLSGIAPTIAQSGDDPFFEPWKVQADTIGLAAFHTDQMRSIVSGVDNKFSNVAKANQQFNGKQAVLLQGAFYQDNVVATLPGWRTEFLTQMGLAIPEDLQQFAVDDHRAFIPRDHVPDVLN
ncbi:MAG: ABC transporter substrate-binding protein, partial [Mycolicibacterium sp.]|nr:ABC transporter substrate-binding protein [Mycolicibacterium sp.]